VAQTPAGATLLFLLSGGPSSLVEVPVAAIGIPELQRIKRWQLGSGLPIGAMNRVRTAVARIKGGGLLAFLPERLRRVLAVSDVPGDDPGVIGSGLLVPRSGLAPAMAPMDLPDWLRERVTLALAERPVTLAPGPEVELLVRLDDAKRTAAQAARDLGRSVRVHTPFLEGDAAARGGELARTLRDGPTGIQVWGGETTVRLPSNPGRSGRNQHLALAAALEIAGCRNCLLLAAGTDGSDGNTADAGALVDSGTLERGALDGLDARDCLARADSGTFLASSGDLIQTDGPHRDQRHGPGAWSATPSRRRMRPSAKGAALLKRRPATKDLAVRAVTFVALLTREASYFMRRDAPVEELAAPGSCGVAPARSEMPGRRPSRH
jgi:glycerate 2-kinase